MKYLFFNIDGIFFSTKMDFRKTNIAIISSFDSELNYNCKLFNVKKSLILFIEFQLIIFCAFFTELFNTEYVQYIFKR